ELLGDGGCVARLEVREQRRVRGLGRPRREEDAADDDREQRDRGDRLLPAGEPGHERGRAPAEIEDLLGHGLDLRRLLCVLGAETGPMTPGSAPGMEEGRRHHTCIRMMSVKASTALLRTATVSSVA